MMDRQEVGMGGKEWEQKEQGGDGTGKGWIESGKGIVSMAILMAIMDSSSAISGLDLLSTVYSNL